MSTPRTSQSGLSFVEIIIVSALSAMIFGALFSSFQFTLGLISDGRAKLTALSIANDRMEYFRSLPYDDVGTLAGIPAGTIPQNGTTTLNGIDFAERVLVEYVDDPADGQDTATTSDNNGIAADYKRIEVEYSWDIGNGSRKISLTSNIVPRSVETNIGGGTIRINVIDADSMLLPGATVQFINDTTTSTINTSRVTNSAGAALLSGAPAASNYEVIVTANKGGKQYSTDRTHRATTSNPNPKVAPFSVLEADVSTLTFQIDELSDVDIATYSSRTEGSVQEEFTDLLATATSTNIEVVGGAAILQNSAGVYTGSGIVYTQIITPTPLLHWDTVRVAADTPLGTDYAVRFYATNASGTLQLIPDTDLSGNSVGLVDTLIDISELDPTAYPALSVGVTLETTNTTITPRLEELEVFYTQSQTPLTAAGFTMVGSKTIGTDVTTAPIYKHQFSFTTDSTGQHTIPDLEFDQYQIESLSGLDMASACPNYPYVHRAGVTGKLALTMVANASHSARVQVVDGLGRMIPGATVTLSRPGYTQTSRTNVCGQTFFGSGVAAGTDYTLEVSLTGYATQTHNDFEVDGDTFESIVLTI